MAANADANVPSRAEVANIVVDTIAEITRYPREILTPEARFDDDLGIDSLKRAEIVTAFLNRFGGPPPDLQTLGPMPLTVGEMADFAASYVDRSGAGAAQHQLPPSKSGASGPIVSSELSVEPVPTVAVSRPALATESANRAATVEGDLKALTERPRRSRRLRGPTSSKPYRRSPRVWPQSKRSWRRAQALRAATAPAASRSLLLSLLPQSGPRGRRRCQPPICPRGARRTEQMIAGQ